MSRNARPSDPLAAFLDLARSGRLDLAMEHAARHALDAAAPGLSDWIAQLMGQRPTPRRREFFSSPPPPRPKPKSPPRPRPSWELINEPRNHSRPMKIRNPKTVREIANWLHSLGIGSTYPMEQSRIQVGSIESITVQGLSPEGDPVNFQLNLDSVYLDPRLERTRRPADKPKTDKSPKTK